MQRRSRVVPTRLKDHVIPTFDPYTHLSDKVISPRHGSPGFIITDLVADKAITTAKGSPGFIDTTLVADRAVTDAKMDWLPQVGSKADGAYLVYPTAYSTAPDGAVCVPLDSFNQGTYPVYLSNLTAGSCIPHGSPSGYLYVTVVGKVT